MRVIAKVLIPSPKNPKKFYKPGQAMIVDRKWGEELIEKGEADEQILERGIDVFKKEQEKKARDLIKNHKKSKK